MTQPAQTSLQNATINIQGMTCNHCAARVEKALSAVPGVSTAQVQLPENAATIRFDPTTASIPKIMQAVKDAGYSPTGFAKN